MGKELECSEFAKAPISVKEYEDRIESYFEPYDKRENTNLPTFNGFAYHMGMPYSKLRDFDVGSPFYAAIEMAKTRIAIRMEEQCHKAHTGSPKLLFAQQDWSEREAKSSDDRLTVIIQNDDKDL